MERIKIKFTIDADQYEEIKHYSKVKGFDKPAHLARKALFDYMGRNKLTERQRTGAEKSGEALELVKEF